MKNKTVRKILKSFNKQHGNLHIKVNDSYCVGLERKGEDRILIQLRDLSNSKIPTPMTVLEMLMMLNAYLDSVDVYLGEADKFVLSVSNYR